ncbi:MAG: FkbM family methyltransferase [Candidatus Doudnabacteria bacterium]|jgi:FkbM family methyltransferase
MKKLFNLLLGQMMNIRERIYNFLDSQKPFLNKIKYCGFDLYYGQRSGIVNRIRFGHLSRKYEPELCDAIILDLKKSQQPIFIDIGANIGFISLAVFSKVPQTKIFAFEPGIHQNKMLDITILANGLQNNIILSKQAVSNTTGATVFQIHKNEAESVGDGLIDTRRGGETSSVSVPVIRLDDWWISQKQIGVSVIKIDTEGAELYILQGAEKMIKACKPIIYLEISLLNLKSYPYTAHDILEWLVSHNYYLYTIDGSCVENENLEKLATIEDSFVARPGKI